MGVKFQVTEVVVCDGGANRKKLAVPSPPPNCVRSDKSYISPIGRGKASFSAFLHADNQESFSILRKLKKSPSKPKVKKVDFFSNFLQNYFDFVFKLSYFNFKNKRKHMKIPESFLIKKSRFFRFAEILNFFIIFSKVTLQR